MKANLTPVAIAPLRRPTLALLAFAAFVPACAPTLPPVESVGDPRLAPAPVRTIAVLPADVSIDADDPHDPSAASLEQSRRAEAKARPIVDAALRQALARRGYVVRDATLPPEIAPALRDWLYRYGFRTLVGESQPGADALPGSLPWISADATLYLGGDGHLKEDESHRAIVAKNVAIGFAIGIAVTAFVVLCVFAVRGGGGGALDGLGRAMEGLGKVTLASVRVGTALALDPRVHLEVARVSLDALAHVDPSAFRADEAPPIDAVEIRPPVADHGEANALRLSATLVDNRTGAILWSGAQVMPIDPVDPRELRQATEHILDELPSPPPPAALPN